MHSEIHRDMADDTTQTDLASPTRQQRPMVEDEVTIGIEETIRNCGDGRFSSDCCIYRMPIMIRDLKKEAYTPKVVSMGPFHYGNDKLQEMKRHKQVLFKRFTQRTTSSLDDLFRCVKHLEPRVRASYSDIIQLNEQELVKLALMDAGFIIELFIMSYMGRESLDHDAKLLQPWLHNSIINDLLLLENQLPFFVIEELFNEAFPPSRFPQCGLPSFLELTYGYFRRYNRQKLEPNPDVEIKHFTDLLRLFNLQGKTPERESFSDELGSHILLYNANALQEAGIKLKANNVSKCLLDLKFSGDIFEIPQILVEDDTEIVFRNIIALEQCHYPYHTCFTDYVLVLDYLIDTSKDVDLLVHKKIVSHVLGDTNAVASLFNGLGKNVTQTNFNSEYLAIFRSLNGYCQNRWHQMKATLRRDYCNTPWRTAASIAGIMLLLLTIVQTIFSVLQVVLNK